MEFMCAKFHGYSTFVTNVMEGHLAPHHVNTQVRQG